jgi:hypothetical protein
MASRSFDSSATANVHIYMFACAATCGTVPYRTRRLGSIPLYASLPTLINSVVSTGSATPLYGFVGATVLATTMMGGTYAIMPAYEADLYGAKYVGAIHGRFLLFGASMAGVFGPALILQLRAQSESRAMCDLLDKVDPGLFQDLFNTDISAAPELIESKTLTIAKLMSIAPEGTGDPTPFMYDSTMYAMAGIMSVAAISHAAVGPVNQKHFEEQK